MWLAAILAALKGMAAADKQGRADGQALLHSGSPSPQPAQAPPSASQSLMSVSPPLPAALPIQGMGLMQGNGITPPPAPSGPQGMLGINGADPANYKSLTPPPLGPNVPANDPKAELSPSFWQRPGTKKAIGGLMGFAQGAIGNGY
jgi:hypothetical protein